MTEKRLEINGSPAVLYGDGADDVWLYVHGRSAYKEVAADFAAMAVPRGAQVLAIDLPGHGERKAQAADMTPWHMTGELRALADWARERWGRVSLRADSIGAFFSLMALEGAGLQKSLLVSPVLDMEKLIGKMMVWAGVTEEELREKKIIPTAFGEDLSWEYLQYVRAHPIASWGSPTAILYAGRDELTDRETVEDFAGRFGCALTVMEDGEHWFHTPEQLEALRRWTEESL